MTAWPPKAAGGMWNRKSFADLSARSSTPTDFSQRFNLEEDYMRAFKRSMDFQLSVEPSVIPAWIALECFPIHLLNKPTLFSIANLIGKPMKIDGPTTNLSRPSIARICVEMDLLKVGADYMAPGKELKQQEAPTLSGGTKRTALESTIVLVDAASKSAKDQTMLGQTSRCRSTFDFSLDYTASQGSPPFS
ncbi:hypothetical protein M9H77_35770 [Catharanthus roseus]|uniref:Uncharacterized protein n=1 Tax=Catharanthus roseus TaxID=4058 RepID=A0ACB9ZTM3_CATRO|nr:hypothetical protein M9H77_35770 [Catharanthus roseus]